jgi:MSHA biogenesis protein MshN
MSLINDMLRDLDRRHGGTGALPNEVRPLPPERPLFPARLLVLLVALIGALSVAGWLFMDRMPQAQIASVAPVVQPVAATAKVAEPAPPPAPVAAEPAPSQESAASPGGLRLDAALNHLPQPAPSSDKAVAETGKESLASVPAKPAPPVKTPAPQAAAARTPEPAARPAAPPAEQAPAAAAAKPASGETAGASGGIEKRPRIETPKERAEQDYRKAYSLLTRGRAEEAVPLLRSALAEDSAHASARIALAGILSQSGRPDEALALLSEGLQLDPTRPALALSAARLLVSKGNFDGAAQILSRASASAQSDAEFRAFHAAVLQRLTLHKDAVKEYQAALRHAPHAGVWWMGLGISLEADGRGSEARDAYERARASGALSAELDRFVEQKLRQLK